MPGLGSHSSTAAVALGLDPASQSQRPTSSSPTSGTRTSSSAWSASAQRPCIPPSAAARTPSSRRSTGAAVRGRRGGRAPPRPRPAGRRGCRGRWPTSRPRAPRGASRAPVGVERLEASGRAEEQSRGVAATSLLKRDLPAQVLHLRGQQRVQRAGLDRHQQSQCRVERARVALRPGRREQPPHRGERARASALPLARGTLRPRPGRRALALGPRSARALPRRPRRAPRGMRAVPGAPVGIEPRIGHLRERVVRVLSLPRRGRPVRRRTHERMAKPHAPAELDQSGLDRRRRSLGPDPEPLGCSPHQHRLAPPDPPPRAAGGAGSPREACPGAAGNSPRCARRAEPRQGGRIRPPARQA